jgi:NAD(P)-dependent dehydrogenase (short-subunit alcohol dehydrogenase family)
MSTHEWRLMLSGQVAIVTGAGSGIGRATALALADEEVTLVLADADEQGVARTAADLAGHRPGQRVIGMRCDVRREEDVDRLVARTLDECGGRIDALIACAGILRPKGSQPKPLAEITPAEWDAVIDTNLRGMFLCNRAVLGPMIAQRGGHIVNLSSTSGRQGRALDAPYCASKFGVIGLSEALAEEVRPYGVRLHIVLPDAVATPMWDQNGPIAAPADALPPSRVADFIVYLLRLPEDTVLVSPVIAPFKTRKRISRPAARDSAPAVVEQ